MIKTNAGRGLALLCLLMASCSDDTESAVGAGGTNASGGAGGQGGTSTSTAGGGGAGTGGAAGSATCSNPATDVTVSPGDSIQAAVDDHPAGTRFLLAQGVFRGEEIFPKEGDEFYGELASSCERLTTLNGSRALDAFVAQGPIWSQAGQSQEGQVHGQCETGWERCDRPEDLYFDDTPLHHVGSVAEVGPGTWFFDYDNDTVYLGDDPTGHVVEIGDARVAFSPSAPGVRVQSLVIEKYAIPPQMGAIGDQYPSTGWHVENSEIRLNHGTGVNVSSASAVIGNFIHHNGQKGVGAGGDDVLYEGNEIAFNNYAHVDPGWEAGGSKFSHTNRLTVRANCVHHNAGPGLWTDIDNVDTLYEGNVVFRNVSMGIFHEISYAAVVRDNLVGDNGEDFAWLYGSQILISTSQDAEVSGNSVEVPADHGNGIGVIWQDRPPYQGVGNVVHDNDVTFLGDGDIWQGTPAQTGVAADFDPATTQAFQQNSLDANRYHMTSTSTRHFSWANAARSFAEIQAEGQEATGSVDSYVQPRDWSCALLSR